MYKPAAALRGVFVMGCALASASALGAAAPPVAPAPAAGHAPTALPAPATLSLAAAPARSGWQIGRVAQGDCVARRVGQRVDTMVMLNPAGTLVLIAGRRDWKLPRGPKPVSLTIDEHRWANVSALSLQTLLMVLVTDPTMLEQLQHARMIRWGLPAGGSFTADVAGMGQIIDTLSRCRH